MLRSPGSDFFLIYSPPTFTFEDLYMIYYPCISHVCIYSLSPNTSALKGAHTLPTPSPFAIFYILQHPPPPPPTPTLNPGSANATIWPHFSEKGPSAYIIKFPVRANRNIMLALKCMANYKFRALQLHYRYSNSQCVRSNV